MHYATNRRDLVFTLCIEFDGGNNERIQFVMDRSAALNEDLETLHKQTLHECFKKLIKYVPKSSIGHDVRDIQRAWMKVVPPELDRYLPQFLEELKSESN